MSLSRRNRTSKKLSVGESGVDKMGVGEILGLEPFRLLLGPPGTTGVSLLLQIFSGVV